MSLAARHLVPERLDLLPPDDPGAIGSRRDLRQINRLMAQPRLAAALLRRHLRQPPRRIVELGAGDGVTSLALARRLAPHWPGVTMVLLDRHDLAPPRIRAGFAALGWRVETVAADVFDWLDGTSGQRFDAVLANLFLHHFDAELPGLLAGAARLAPVFVATEPRRDRLSLAGSRLLGLIGANAVTRHDAPASVRAGFAGTELTRLWPAAARPASAGPARSAARRPSRTPSSPAGSMPQIPVPGPVPGRVPMPDAVIIGGGPAGATAAILLARGGLSVTLVERAAFPRRKVCGEFLTATNIELLQRLGIDAAWQQAAGPEIRRVALFCGEASVSAPLPGRNAFGRALGRETLDTLLLETARAAGAEILQPCRATAIEPDGTGGGRDGGDGGGDHTVHIATPDGERTLRAPVIIAAHGSWQPGPLPTQPPKMTRGDALLGFKAHFTGGTLDPELMPLLSFPGGYGGLVTADAGRISLSCCIRRDRLDSLRAEDPGRPAAEIVLAHIRASCEGAARALAGAEVLDGWLSAGPIRPGIRPRYAAGIFRAGNAAMEAHPIVAEGIGMALQSGRLLAEALLELDTLSPPARALAGRRYAAATRRRLAPRILAAAAFARLSTSDTGRPVVAAVIRRMPFLLSGGAMLSGKRAAA